MSFTIAPLHHLYLDESSITIPFGKNIILCDIPQWILANEYLSKLFEGDRDDLKKCKFVFLADYSCSVLGQPDPDWTGTGERSIQDTRFEAIILASMAIWMIQPSSVHFTSVFHAFTTLYTGRIANPPLVLAYKRHDQIFPHPLDYRNQVLRRHLLKASKLFGAMESVPHYNSLWEATRSCWHAITTEEADRRFVIFWTALEALFGKEKADSDLKKRLATRIAWFLADKLKDAKKIFEMALRSYDMRCKIVHGRWDNDPQVMILMRETELIVRTAFRNILDDPSLTRTFASLGRNTFLSSLVDKRARTLGSLAS